MAAAVVPVVRGGTTGVGAGGAATGVAAATTTGTAGTAATPSRRMTVGAAGSTLGLPLVWFCLGRVPTGRPGPGGGGGGGLKKLVMLHNPEATAPSGVNFALGGMQPAPKDREVQRERAEDAGWVRARRLSLIE